MLKSVRRRPSPALAISSVALFLALGGGAVAAATSDTTKDKRIATRVVRHLAPTLSVAHAAAAGTANNATHASSAGTADNASSLGGQPASAYVQYGTLPSGKTETGVFGIRDTMTGVEDRPDDAITFPTPLASAPTFSTTAADCTGSVSHPTAAPGKLCLYLGQVNDVSGYTTVDPETGALGTSRFGVVLFARSSGAGDKIFRGTWAVTAP